MKKKLKKILIMGLPGAGKTFLAKKLYPLLNAIWINADKIRKINNDWDFSPKGRERQALRMEFLANEALKKGKNVIVDFVCPTNKTRNKFNADYIIWMDTIKKGRFLNTNKIFTKPKNVDFRVTTKNAAINAIIIADKIKKFKWDNKKPTVQLLGRWQPWHYGHQKLLESAIKKTGQVHIMVRDVYKVGDNPFNFSYVKKKIIASTKIFGKRIKISLVPNITNICYGRKVGYKIEKIILKKKIQVISATKIRAKMRDRGEL